MTEPRGTCFIQVLPFHIVSLMKRTVHLNPPNTFHSSQDKQRMNCIMTSAATLRILLIICKDFLHFCGKISGDVRWGNLAYNSSQFEDVSGV